MIQNILLSPVSQFSVNTSCGGKDVSAKNKLTENGQSARELLITLQIRANNIRY